MDIAPDPVAVLEPAGAVALPVIDAVEPDEPREAAAETEVPAANVVQERPAESTIIDCTCCKAQSHNNLILINHAPPGPHPKAGLVPPQPIDQVLPEVWQPLGKTCNMFNQTVRLIRVHRSRQSEDALATAMAIKAVATTVPSVSPDMHC